MHCVGMQLAPLCPTRVALRLDATRFANGVSAREKAKNSGSNMLAFRLLTLQKLAIGDSVSTLGETHSVGAVPPLLKSEGVGTRKRPSYVNWPLPGLTGVLRKPTVQVQGPFARWPALLTHAAIRPFAFSRRRRLALVVSRLRRAEPRRYSAASRLPPRWRVLVFRCPLFGHGPSSSAKKTTTQNAETEVPIIPSTY